MIFTHIGARLNIQYSLNIVGKESIRPLQQFNLLHLSFEVSLQKNFEKSRIELIKIQPWSSSFRTDYLREILRLERRSTRVYVISRRDFSS